MKKSRGSMKYINCNNTALLKRDMEEIIIA